MVDYLFKFGLIPKSTKNTPLKAVRLPRVVNMAIRRQQQRELMTKTIQIRLQKEHMVYKFGIRHIKGFWKWM